MRIKKTVFTRSDHRSGLLYHDRAGHPAAHAARRQRRRRLRPLIEALFTSTSASCVTGLVLRDTATQWSVFGQAIIIVLIQIGGLGFMTISTFFFLFMRRNIGLRNRRDE
jgi:hypothetical protein